MLQTGSALCQPSLNSCVSIRYLRKQNLSGLINIDELSLQSHHEIHVNILTCLFRRLRVCSRRLILVGPVRSLNSPKPIVEQPYCVRHIM